jgi:sulfoxide reductase catalytic subunit YedY
LLIRVKKPHQIAASSITDEEVYRQRRRFMQAGLSVLAGAALVGCDSPVGDTAVDIVSDVADVSKPQALEALIDGVYGADLTPTDYKYVTTYNNFIELGSGKTEPAQNAHQLITRPWTVRVDGECEAPGEIGIEDILARFPTEDRIYRLRCVEAWAMVVPWQGFPLSDLLRRFKPTSRAKYVAFESIEDADMLPAQRRSIPYDWPYTEGLRMDEAMHPLTIIATGLYDEKLPNQNGAPLRLVVPWKYGFKSAKSIVRIRFTHRQPKTLWNELQGSEYGFYANVNPEVDHPRWSQRRHRVIGAGLFAPREETLMFNGYADAVAHLYAGMDLRKHY